MLCDLQVAANLATSRPDHYYKNGLWERLQI